MRGGALDKKVATAAGSKAVASKSDATPAAAPVAPYEKQLDADLRWALSEGGRFFEGKSLAHDALLKITGRLRELGIPYAVSGGMALFMHGYRRFTDDVDLLVTREGLKLIHEKLAGLGYVHPFTKSKNLRDVELGVRIEFLVTGGFPGDGKPKPIAFPDPEKVAVERDGIKYLSLPTLIALKLASARKKDVGDVEELIKLLDLRRDFSEEIDSYVRHHYVQLWDEAHQTQKKYMTLWRNTFVTSGAKNLDEMIGMMEESLKTLQRMRADGVTLDSGAGTGDEFAYLATDDPEVAKKYDMQDSHEFWVGGDEPDVAEPH